MDAASAASAHAPVQHFEKIFGLACAAGCDHRNVRGVADRESERAVEAGLHAIGIHGSEQDLACAQFLAASRPLDGIDPFIVAAAAGVNVPSAVWSCASRIDREHHRLRAEFFAQLSDQLGTAHRRGVDADFVRAGVQNAARVVDAADAAAHRERNENLAGGAGDHVDHGVAIVAGSGDVEEHQFVGALLVVARGEFHGIARIAQVDEVDALDHASGGDVETRNDSFCQHQLSTKLRTICNPSAPDFSG